MFLGTNNHISVDLETLGTDGQPVILSIGAVRFDPLQKEGVFPDNDTFYRSIFIPSCMKVGMTIDGHTLHWWMDQSNEAIATAFSGEFSLDQVLRDFNLWSTNFGTEDQDFTGYLYGWSAAFDCSHLETAYRLAEMKMPFDFRHQICGRTIARIAMPQGIDYDNYPTSYPRHHALGDAIVQARIIQDSLKRLGVKG